jgi:hypothetical protein
MTTEITTEFEFEEYYLGDGRFIQVAIDPDLDGEIVEYVETDGSLAEWVIG